MAVSVKTTKMLWGRAANRCSICQMELVMDATETDDEAIVGEEAHIIPQSPNGPRGGTIHNPEQIDNYSNLILLCAVHHTLVDKQPKKYTVEKLQLIKKEHEKWVSDTLEVYDKKRQKDDEIYAEYMDEWSRRIKLDKWEGWTSYLLTAGVNGISAEMDDAIADLNKWIYNRIWPKRYGRLEAAFQNFRLVIQDFSSVFHEHSKQSGQQWFTDKFYHISEWNPERYEKLSKEYDYHVRLLEDLVLEMTRAANYICDYAREFIMPTYRMKEGVILVTSGLYEDFRTRTHRVEYRSNERIDIPYPGLEKFKTKRYDRDYYFGLKSKE